MRANRIQGRVSLVFLAFFSLVTISVVATFWGIRQQDGDAVTINLAGRQRMLTQKMTWLALARPQDPELTASIQLFEQTLDALRRGGSVAYEVAGKDTLVVLPPAPDAGLRASLEEADKLWVEFRAQLTRSDPLALQASSAAILARLDSIVSEYEAHARAKLARVQVIQAISFASALLLLAWGYLLVRQRIFFPLAGLGAAARRMASGELDKPLQPTADDELGELAGAFETMRQEIATSRGQLEARVAQRTRELLAAFEFSQEIVAQLDLEHLLQSVTERARVLTNSNAAALCLLEEDRSTLVLAASSGGRGAQLQMRQALQRDSTHRVVDAGETIVTPANCAHCQFLEAHAPGQCAVAPLRAGDATLGALCVVRPPGQEFDPDETRALTLLSNAAAIAIANAQLVRSSRLQAEQSAALAERERLAAELHDNLAQTFSFLGMKVDRVKSMLTSGQAEEGLKDLDLMKTATGRAYVQVRDALVGLSEPLPIASDFAQRLKAAIDEFRHASSLPVELRIADPGALALPRLAQAQALHIVREALANIQRHAAAQQAWVRLDCENGRARFTIEDDGCGFDPQAVVGSHHLGLRLMRSRAVRVGGGLEVESAPGEGARVVAWLPIKD